jgi:hAT family dimerisation domain.
MPGNVYSRGGEPVAHEGLFVALDKSKYPELKKAACRIISILGTTYLCESLYSTLKFVKSKHRSVLTNQHQKKLLRNAATNYSPNFKELSREVK